MYPHVGLVTPEHHESLLDLLCELHTHHNPSSHSASSTALKESMRSHLFQNLLLPSAPLRLVVASLLDLTVTGLAAFMFLDSVVEPAPEKRRQCMMKELYVRKAYRSRGVGKALMSWVAQHAVTAGCCRIDWHVQSANDRGINFYEGLGATIVSDRRSYRLASSALTRLAGRCGRDAQIASIPPDDELPSA